MALPTGVTSDQAVDYIKQNMGGNNAAIFKAASDYGLDSNTVSSLFSQALGGAYTAEQAARDAAQYGYSLSPSGATQSTATQTGGGLLATATNPTTTTPATTAPTAGINPNVGIAPDVGLTAPVTGPTSASGATNTSVDTPFSGGPGPVLPSSLTAPVTTGQIPTSAFNTSLTTPTTTKPTTAPTPAPTQATTPAPTPTTTTQSTTPANPASTATATSAGTSSQKPNSSPVTAEIDPEKMTVEGRIAKLLADNNPALQQAGERAMGMFAQRGLLNSSMASEAAMEAMISKAIDIAGPDAAAYLKQSQLNQEWMNKFGLNQQTQNFSMEKLAQEHANDLAKLDKQFAQQQTILDKQQTNLLHTNYLTSVGSIKSRFDVMRQAISMSTDYATPEDRQAALSALDVQEGNAMRLNDLSYENIPMWNKAWSQVGESFTQAEAKAAVTTNGAATVWDGGAASVKNLTSDQLLNELNNTKWAIGSAQWKALEDEVARRDAEGGW